MVVIALLGLGALFPAVVVGAQSSANPFVGFSANPGGEGYWLVHSNGTVSAFGDANHYGDASSIRLNAGIESMASTPTGKGYWLAAADGGVFTFGDAQFFGSAANFRLVAPVRVIEATPSGAGYWLLATDGGVFAFGDAQFHGRDGPPKHALRPGATPGPGPLDDRGFAGTPSGGGYWIVRDGGVVLPFGDAERHGDPSALSPGEIVSIEGTPTGEGYWVAGADGGVFAYGDAGFFGSAHNFHPVAPVRVIEATTSGAGYWLMATDGGVFAFGDAAFHGSGTQL
ncbi:MAG: hypothetical protein KY429_10520 [Actinobacteria bacterium]|nr:hypothetical protein [Actinomycetota bacterium]